MRRLVPAALLAVSFSLIACTGVTVQPTVMDCYAWPQEGSVAYAEIQNVCGGESMPLCPAHKEWRFRLENLKNQLDACKPKEL